jgi:hypothetical protein
MHRVIIALGAAGWLVTTAPFVSARTLAPAHPTQISQAQADAIQETPLLAARQNLLLARSRVLEHKYSEAIRPLSAAAEALAYFERQELGQKGRDAGFARQEIEDYANEIETDHSEALSRIKDWLDWINELGGGR